MNASKKDERPRTISWTDEVDWMAQSLAASYRCKRGVSELLELLVVAEAMRTNLAIRAPSDRLLASMEKVRHEMMREDVQALNISGIQKIKQAIRKGK